MDSAYQRGGPGKDQCVARSACVVGRERISNLAANGAPIPRVNHRDCNNYVLRRVWREMRDFAALKRLSLLWIVLIFAQISLGAWVIWSNKAADVATAHVALGAVMLSFGVSISAICWRISGRDPAVAGRCPDAAARRPYHRERTA